jgi:hypothetical protein
MVESILNGARELVCANEIRAALLSDAARLSLRVRLLLTLQLALFTAITILELVRKVLNAKH